MAAFSVGQPVRVATQIKFPWADYTSAVGIVASASDDAPVFPVRVEFLSLPATTFAADVLEPADGRP